MTRRLDDKCRNCETRLVMQPELQEFCSRDCYVEWKGALSEERIREYWGNGKPLTYKKKKWRVARMSYGTFFLEPYDPKYPQGRGERFPFSKGTLELETHPVHKNLFRIHVELL